LVSRQTVSLWETDQTLPTVDNLRLLRDVFGVSIDELLGVEPAPAPDEPTPLESYTFRHTREHVEMKFLANKRRLLMCTCLLLVVSVFALVVALLFSDHRTINLVLAVVGGFFMARMFGKYRNFCKTLDSEVERMLANTCTYRLYENELHVKIQKGDECLENLHIPYNALTEVGCSEFYYEIYYLGRNYLVPRSLFASEDTAPCSRFETLLKSAYAAKKRTVLGGKWRVISILLVVLSIVSVAVAMICFIKLIASDLPDITWPYQNDWVFLAFLPIPVASVCVGIYLVCKRKRAFKNIIVGIIVTCLLFTLGTMGSSMNVSMQEQGEAMFLEAETKLGIDFPDAERFYLMSVSFNNGKEGRKNIVMFDQDDCAVFESLLSLDRRWMTELPSDLDPYSMRFFSQNPEPDYVLLYNVSTGKFNSAPEGSGIYCYLQVEYFLDTHSIMIYEYDLYC